jgi:hypothetical protein
MTLTMKIPMTKMSGRLQKCLPAFSSGRISNVRMQEEINVPRYLDVYTVTCSKPCLVPQF